jgi:hypothetical protein
MFIEQAFAGRYTAAVPAGDAVALIAEWERLINRSIERQSEAEERESKLPSGPARAPPPIQQPPPEAPGTRRQASGPPPSFRPCYAAFLFAISD